MIRQPEMRKHKMLPRRTACAITMGVMLLVPLSAKPVVGAAAQAPVAASGQAAVPTASGQSAASTVTTYEPRYENVYETRYDTECVQVPVTQTQTRYRTEYQTQTVPVGRQYFQFDNEPGMEKVVLVVSPKPIDLERDFPGYDRNGSAGSLKASASSRRACPSTSSFPTSRPRSGRNGSDDQRARRASPSSSTSGHHRRLGRSSGRDHRGRGHRRPYQHGAQAQPGVIGQQFHHQRRPGRRGNTGVAGV